VSAQGGTERPAFDPRHDARFQRGYRPGGDDAAPVERPRTSAPASARPPASAPRAAGPTPAPDRRLDGTTPGPVVEPESENVLEDDDSDLAGLGFDTDSFRDEPAGSRWNPFIALLWMLGLALPTAGVALQWQAVQSIYSNGPISGSGEPSVDFILQQFSYLVAPTLITPGIIIIAGLLFWHARGWQARRRPRPHATPD
jgi:hypothetical protein